ncbi:MAG: tyrosine--tRNA ligase [Patescibacteria group bacterium]|nr:tyrosine--tRNA ligase [Patescibacteria group bacterium]
MDILQKLKKRGYISQTSNDEGVASLLAKERATIYQGFDPSADSFTLGHLMPLMMLHHLQEAGHKIIFLIGGGTGKIGDPADKAFSRKLLDPETVAENAESLKKQVENIGLISFDSENKALMLDNNKWLSKFRFLDDFLLKVARHFSVNEMVKMETFSRRLESESHLSLLEFCYPVLQGWDFLYLFENHNCKIQVGGNDQWANILAGVDLIRRKHGEDAFAITHPLITTPSGEKMGKTAEGTIWLDPEKTNPFDFYQYLQGVPDEIVPIMLKTLTFLPLEKIEDLLRDPREAQKKLAFEVTKLVHGEDTAKKVARDTKKIFGEEEGKIEAVPTFKLPKEGLELDELLKQSSALPSKSESKRRVQQNAVEIDGKNITDPKTLIAKPCLIRYGKNSFLKITQG